MRESGESGEDLDVKRGRELICAWSGDSRGWAIKGKENNESEGRVRKW